jgi:CBS domain containing-hemolysin-like protein
MRQRGAAAEIVVDAQGRVLGMLTTENVAEMMLVESARPGWRFRRR